MVSAVLCNHNMLHKYIRSNTVEVEDRGTKKKAHKVTRENKETLSALMSVMMLDHSS